MGLHRSALQRRRRTDADDTKVRNATVKSKERARRDVRMAQIIKDGEPPFAPAVMSWLSRKLRKKASRITVGDIETLAT